MPTGIRIFRLAAVVALALFACDSSEGVCSGHDDCERGASCIQGKCSVLGGAGGTGIGGAGGLDCSAICEENASCLPDPASSHCCTCPADTLCSATMGICVSDEGTGGTGPGGAGGEGVGGAGGEGVGGAGGEGAGGAGGEGAGGAGGESAGGAGGEGAGGGGPVDCHALCAGMAGCSSGAPNTVYSACLDECELEWEAATMGCVQSALATCDLHGVSACFPGDPTCEAGCTNVYFACGEWIPLPIGSDRHDCAAACEAGILPFDPSCLASAACWDIWSCPTVEVPTCESICGEVANCGSGDPIAIEAFCIDDCASGWSAPSFGCVDGVASTCDVPSIAACFPGDSLCEEACTKAYFDCGVALAVPYGVEIGRESCISLCELHMLNVDVACIAASQCADFASCKLPPPSCVEACHHIYGECGSIIHPPWDGPWARASCANNCVARLGWEIRCLSEVSCPSYQSDPDQCWYF